MRTSIKLTTEVAAGYCIRLIGPRASLWQQSAVDSKLERWFFTESLGSEELKPLGLYKNMGLKLRPFLIGELLFSQVVFQEVELSFHACAPCRVVTSPQEPLSGLYNSILVDYVTIGLISLPRAF